MGESCQARCRSERAAARESTVSSQLVEAAAAKDSPRTRSARALNGRLRRHTRGTPQHPNVTATSLPAHLLAVRVDNLQRLPILQLNCQPFVRRHAEQRAHGSSARGRRGGAPPQRLPPTPKSHGGRAAGKQHGSLTRLLCTNISRIVTWSLAVADASLPVYEVTAVATPGVVSLHLLAVTHR